MEQLAWLLWLTLTQLPRKTLQWKSKDQIQKDLLWLEKSQRDGVAKNFGQQSEKSMWQKLHFPHSQEKFPTRISTFALSASPDALMDPRSRRSVHCKDIPGSVLSLALVPKMVIETQARFNKGPKTLGLQQSGDGSSAEQHFRAPI